MSHAADAAAYPSRTAERDRWIVRRRPPRNVVSDDRPYASFVEDEVDASGTIRRVATIFLTNRECPYRCLMCDLWQNTLEHTVRAGAIAAQIDLALDGLPPTTVVKLYNSGSFFDPRAIPPEEHPGIASRLARFERAIVECHPAFVGPPVARFRDLLPGELEVAMGLETANPDVLERLNKRMTLDSYAAAASTLRGFGVASRAFVLVQPPFQPAEDAVDWAVRSASFAFDHGAGAVSLIPVRSGNGALDALAAAGTFEPPTLATVERAVDGALALGRGRVFADTWDLERFSRCPDCLPARAERLRRLNDSQRREPAVACARCSPG
ncbi:MAG: radical SAM protein [Gemmatimonadetes bacterium]|nr:radical SAM protein [Gemmatimonadota bacterium]